MCYGVTIEISCDPVLSSNNDFRKAFKFVLLGFFAKCLARKFLIDLSIEFLTMLELFVVIKGAVNCRVREAKLSTTNLL